MKVFYFLTLFLVTACIPEKNLPDCTPEDWQYTFESGKMITLDTIKITGADTTYERYAYQVKEGNNLVFNYIHAFEDCREIADDEQTDKLVFEIPAGATAVTWEDSAAFQQGKLYYQQIGAWGTPPVLLKQGKLEGQKITDNRWHIKASLQMPGINRTLDVDHDFMP